MNRQTFLDSFGHIADAPGGIDKLRRLILDLAVRGALTDQDSTDESSWHLVERIAEERSRLVAAKEIRAPKGLGPVHERTVPYGLPAGWNWVWLSDALLKLTDGTHHSPPNGPNGEYPYVSAKNVKDGYMRLDHLTFVSAQDHEEIWARCDPRPGDVLFVKDGATTGNAALVQLEEPFSMLSSVALLRPGHGLDDRYLLLAMRSPTVRSELREGMKGSAITRTTLTKLGKVLFPLPPSAEQLRIVDRVDELMALCDELEEQRAARAEAGSTLTAAMLYRITDADTPDDLHAAIGAFAGRVDLHLAPGDGDLAALKRLRQTILDLAVRGRLTQQDPTDESATVLLQGAKLDRECQVAAKAVRKSTFVPEPLLDAGMDQVPSGWAPVLLGALGAWGSGATPSRSTPAYYGGAIPWLKSGELSDDYVSSSEETITELALRETSVKLRQRGDVLIAMYGATIGRTAILDFEATTNQAVCACRPYEGIYNRFLHVLLMSMREAFVGQGAGGAQPNISKEKIEAQVVALPPHAEQVRIVERVDELMALCDELEQQFLAARSLCADLGVSVVAHAIGVPENQPLGVA